MEGVPQGCVLSVTLFAIKINGIISNIPNDSRYHYSLYVDDFQLAYRHHDLKIIENKLQTCIDHVTMWTNENGFTFSTAKIRAVHFTTLKGLHLRQSIKLYGSLVDYEDSFKFLGLIFANSPGDLI